MKASTNSNAQRGMLKLMMYMQHQCGTNIDAASLYGVGRHVDMIPHMLSLGPLHQLVARPTYLCWPGYQLSGRPCHVLLSAARSDQVDEIHFCPLLESTVMHRGLNPHTTNTHVVSQHYGVSNKPMQASWLPLSACMLDQPYNNWHLPWQTDHKHDCSAVISHSIIAPVQQQRSCCEAMTPRPATWYK